MSASISPTSPPTPPAPLSGPSTWVASRQPPLRRSPTPPPGNGSSATPAPSPSTPTKTVVRKLGGVHLDRHSPPLLPSYGGVSPHERSHGESFLDLVNHRFGPGGPYLLDEPQCALSYTAAWRCYCTTPN